MVQPYYYQRVENHVLQDAYFSPEAETAKQFEKKDQGEVRYYPFRPKLEDLLIAYQIQKTGQPTNAPRIIIGRLPTLTGEDVAEMIQLDEASLAALGALTRQLRGLDLALPSHRREAERVIALAQKYAALCFTAAKLERCIASALTAGQATEPNTIMPEEGWFNSWSEGPFSTVDVAGFVNQDSRAAKEFHLTDGRTYANVVGCFPKTRPSENELPPVPANAVGRAAQWVHGVAALLLFVFAWLVRVAK
jgi:hypothetical protein